MKLHPLGALGAQVSDIDLREPLAAAQVRAIEDAMDRFGVLVFRDQPIDQHQQISFAKCFGPLDVGLRRIKQEPHRFAYNELADISNVDVAGSVVVACPREDRQQRGQPAVALRLELPAAPCQVLDAGRGCRAR